MDNHFKQQEWIDYVRGVLRPDRAGILASHLREGCTHCSQTVGVWRNVALQSQREPLYQPPERAVQEAKALFQLHHLPLRGWPVRLAEILYDSMLQPAPAGVRSSNTAGRLLVSHADGLRIEVSLTLDAAQDEVSLCGQIFDPANPKADFTGTQVILIQDHADSQDTETGRYGEFSLYGKPDRAGWLVMDVEGRKPIAVTVPAVGES